MANTLERATISVDRRTAEALEAQARQRGLSLDAYLRTVAAGAAPPMTATVDAAVPAMGAAELDRWFDELSEGTERLPSLPADLSRADVYADRD